MKCSPLRLAVVGMFAAAASLLTAAPAQAADAPRWSEDFAAAASQAKQNHKMLLLDFTGSDWCPYCIQLHKKVFESQPFAKWASRFVLVELDYPRSKEQSAQVKTQNEQLKNRFNIQGYPTVIILNADQKELTRSVGYDGNAPEDWIKSIDADIAKAQSK